MFDWFWKFLYSITKGLLELIDGILAISNKLCGIESIKIDGEETNFLDYVLFSREIQLAFRIAAILGLVVIVFFSIFELIRNAFRENVEETPTRIAIKAAKAVLQFLFVPVVMYALVWIVNVFMVALYSATLNGASSMGQFLFGAFSEGAFLPGKGIADVMADGFDYTSTSQVQGIIELSDFNYIYSWLVGVAILFALASTITQFIDRAVSIAILFIVSPFSISATILDDGARFKLWRDQVLTKFLTGYGMIIGINVYGLFVSLVSRDNVVFFDNSFVNFLMKIAVILGGAFSLNRITAVVGNLVTAGGGTSEVQANQAASGRLGALARGAVSPMTYFKAARGITNFSRDAANFGFGQAVGDSLGFRTSRYYDKEKNLANKNKNNKGGGSGGKGDGPSDNQNSNSPKYNQTNSTLNNALSGDNNQNNQNNSNENHNNANANPAPTGQNMINSALSGDDDYDDYK